MIDWTKSMKQTFEFYTVDPTTWHDQKRLTKVISANVTNDIDSDLLVSGSMETDEIERETYVREYLVVEQDRATYRFPLATLLVQTPDKTFNGTHTRSTSDGYSPLLELRDVNVPLGYTFPKNVDILQTVYSNTRSYCRAPIVTVNFGELKQSVSDIVANTDDSWLSINRYLLSKANYHYELDELGKIYIAKDVNFSSLMYVYRFTMDNASIVYPDLTISNDTYGIPNRLEVYLSSSAGVQMTAVENTNPDSPVSIPTRGRVITRIDSEPNLQGPVTQQQLELYAEEELKALSTVTKSVCFSHGYNPIAKVGNAVMLDFPEIGLNRVIAKITSQQIDLRPGCKVRSTAIFEERLWK